MTSTSEASIPANGPESACLPISRTRASAGCAHALRPFKAAAARIIFHRSVRRDLMSHATIPMVTWVGPFWADAWVHLSVPKFTGTAESALGPRPPDIPLTRWIYDELHRALLTGRRPVVNTNASSTTNPFATASSIPLLPRVMTATFPCSARIL